jgi:hypothetical protein
VRLAPGATYTPSRLDELDPQLGGTAAGVNMPTNPSSSKGLEGRDCNRTCPLGFPEGDFAGAVVDSFPNVSKNLLPTPPIGPAPRL